MLSGHRLYRLRNFLILLTLVHCQESLQEQGEGCRYDLEEIETNLNASGNINDLIVNCLAHNGSYAHSISISAFTEGNNIPIAVSTTANLACTSCNFTAENPCVTSCSEQCGLCKVSNNSYCLTCRYLMRVEGDDGVCLNRSSCDELGFRGTDEGCKCDGYLQLRKNTSNPNYLLPGEQFTYECVDTCSEPNMARGEICNVCGVERCVRCEYKVFEEEGRNECLTKEEYERKRHLQHLTEKLLDEEEMEKEEREEIELHLAILLPIFCVLVVVMCVALSVIAHYWYPYVDKEGNKRRKTKPTEEDQPTVWRPRPTIRFR